MSDELHATLWLDEDGNPLHVMRFGERFKTPPVAGTHATPEELLELLLPDGYRFHPKHLAPISAWIEATRTLATQLSED